jgi:hypothetical protein
MLRLEYAGNITINAVNVYNGNDAVNFYQTNNIFANNIQTYNNNMR